MNSVILGSAIRRLFRPSLVLAIMTGTISVYLGGCLDGGTSSGGGNPDLTLQIKGTKKNAPFRGFIQFYNVGGDPTFFTPTPDDGFTNPQVILGGEELSTLVLDRGNTINIDGDYLRGLINAHPMQALFKGSAKTSGPTHLPNFNIILTGFDSTAGILQGIHVDTVIGRLRYADGSGGDTLIIDLGAMKEYTGKIDTTGLKSPALGLYVPGTPYYAQVYGDSFHFVDMPAGKLPLRMITADGWVRAMDDSLGKNLPPKLKHGRRLDSLILPMPNPVLAPPVPNPLGHYAFTDSVSITLKAETGASIYYTLDGSTPNFKSNLYTNPITLIASATLKSIAFKKGYNRSPISYNNYQLVPAAPVATPPSKVYQDSISLTLKTKAQNGEIYYTLDGSTPNEFSSKYSGPINLKKTTELKAVTISRGLGQSRITEEKYVLFSDSLAGPSPKP